MALLFAEYYKASQYLVHSNDFTSADGSFNKYQQSIAKVKAFLDFLYFEFIFTLETQQGESA
jgi:hypothetical protein